MTLVLRSAELTVTLEPDDGGAVASLVSAPHRGELLFQAPWPCEPSPARGSGHEPWVRGWRGGWHLLCPNAGETCVHAGRRHPFHGDAALAAWTVREHDGDRAVLEYTEASGLGVLRELSLDGPRLSVNTLHRNEGTEWIDVVHVEHLILGEVGAAPGSVLTLPGGRGQPLSGGGGTAAASSSWPHLAGEDWSTIPEAPAQRFAAVSELAGRWLHLRHPHGAELRLVWNGLPSLWYWLERDAETSPPWDERVRCLGLEPAGVSSSDGLARRAAAGEVWRLAPGDRRSVSVEMTVRA